MKSTTFSGCTRAGLPFCKKFSILTPAGQSRPKGAHWWAGGVGAAAVLACAFMYTHKHLFLVPHFSTPYHIARLTPPKLTIDMPLPAHTFAHTHTHTHTCTRMQVEGHHALTIDKPLPVHTNAHTYTHRPRSHKAVRVHAYLRMGTTSSLLMNSSRCAHMHVRTHMHAHISNHMYVEGRHKLTIYELLPEPLPMHMVPHAWDHPLHAV